MKEDEELLEDEEVPLEVETPGAKKTGVKSNDSIPPAGPHVVNWGGASREDINGYDVFELGKQFDTRIDYARAQFSMMHPFAN